MLQEIEYTEAQKDLVRNALQFLRENQLQSPFSWPENSSYTAPDNGLTCTCQGITTDENCPVHRRIG